MSDGIQEISKEIKPTGEVMQKSFKDGHIAARKVKSSVWNPLSIPGAPIVVGSELGHYWDKDYKNDVLEIIKNADKIGEDMSKAAKKVSKSVTKGK